MTASKQRYQVQYAPMGARRPLLIVCIGAGYSGLMMAIIAEQKMQGRNIEFKVYEMNADLGGTWLVNRYPGCSCDIPAHNYAYSFAPNPAWTHYYASSSQIHQYMKAVSFKYKCDKYFTYRHRVTKANWDEETQKWNLNVSDLDRELDFSESCDILINAGGVLNNWRWPSIPGLEKFKGAVMHSAKWDEDYQFTGKRAAVIGIGSSGIQILPEIAKVAQHVTCFARSETWITPKGIAEPTETDPAVDESCKYMAQELQRFEEDPEYLLKHRRSLADRRIIEFKYSMANKETQEATYDAFKESMMARLGESDKGREIAKMLIPKFPVGCRRLTPGPGFLEALVRDNVTTVWDNIGSIDETGIVTKDGQHIDLDVICCATGFDTTFRPRIPLTGRRGIDLAQLWTDEEPACYFGTTVPGFPNYFSFIGPNSPISNGSLVQAIQATGIYIYSCIEKIQTEGIASMEVTQEATDDYNEHAQEFLNATVWAGPCSSWYKRGTRDGRIVGVYPGSAFQFVEIMRRPRWEDYQYVHAAESAANRFTYLGNGLTRREARNGSVGDTQTLDFDEYWRLMILPDIYE
ncbi:Fc.00g010440.m01.CDS01 [Cosmosporella sp. VM-42]